MRGHVSESERGRGECGWERESQSESGRSQRKKAEVRSASWTTTHLRTQSPEHATSERISERVRMSGSVTVNVSVSERKNACE